jgi:hypothetical protein
MTSGRCNRGKKVDDRRKVQSFDCASQEKQERQKIGECESICNKWKVCTRLTCASDCSIKDEIFPKKKKCKKLTSQFLF